MMTPPSTASTFMHLALAQARQAYVADEVPVGAVIVREGEVIACQSNHMHAHKNPLHHAEYLAIQEALTSVGENHLRDCTLYVTLEPCGMCAGAIALTGLKALYYGAYDVKMGQVDNNGQLLKHEPMAVYGGILEKECADLMKAFFQKKRLTNQD